MAASFNNRLAKTLLKDINLKACKSLQFNFNPWQAETKSIRDFFSWVYSNKYRLTNEKCQITSNVKSDDERPHFEVVFVDDSKAIFKTEALTIYDIAKEFNRLCKIKAPKVNNE